MLFPSRAWKVSFFWAAPSMMAGVFFVTGEARAEVEFRDGDRVLFLGNTVIERAQESEHIETALTLAIPAKNVRFRNLGWSGDTVACDARSYFGPPQEGFERLAVQVRDWKPTVILVCYGAVASFQGEAGLEHFLSGYRRMLTMLEKESGAREIVLLSPPPAETLRPPLPDMTEHNQRLALYRDAIGVLAKERNATFVDLFARLGGGKKERDVDLTENGIHFNPVGYDLIANELTDGLGLPIAKHEDKVELRAKIMEKNRLFFLRWRPTNETYLFGFRKHEQGQNAKEIPMFDPLIEEKEKEIAELVRRARE
jgi:lysophospholipase L1-like esterase